MRKSQAIMIVVSLLLYLCLLVGCGQKGPLYLPAKPSAVTLRVI